ncbi:hypothetical protein QBC37DRAFT_433970 [Rhypophila decipiens]|uniref:Uncharacterized protein n=1 Tax=Rhypophila decipiens TaxID=261697 RepID=A0AAN6XV28_9PEZI|nr:hypothetical protein QBC37DRAFT_433970 [Rhypophila decipiens]
MEAPLGAPAWSLKSHGVKAIKPGSSKFSQKYDSETDTLTTTVNLARRLDTARTGGVLDAISNVSWMRNARVADAVDCAAGLLSDAVVLLAARDDALTTGETQRLPFAEGYNRGVYGGSISGLWAIMDSAFVLDYTIGTKDSRLADSISSAFAEVAAVAETAASEYLAAVLAAEVAYPQGKKVLELWDLAIVMWESGAMWGAGVASLCYTHTGKTNCDRARGDLAGDTWM